MASIPMDQAKTRAVAGKPPISAHPAFPAIVALWFAALLGLGSLVLPVQLIERMITATGIASLVPAAAPPLGFSARAAIALAATVIGALLGIVAARRVAGAGSAPRSRSRDDDHDHGDDDDAYDDMRTLNALEDLDDDGLDADLPPLREEHAPAPAGRRRALAMQEDQRKSDFLQVAPLPGQSDDDALELGLEYASEDELAGAPVPVEAYIPPAPIHEWQELAADESEEYGDDDAEDEMDAPEQPLNFTRTARAEPATGEPLAFSPPSLARQADAVAEDAAEDVAEDVAEEAFIQDDTNFEASEASVSDHQIFDPAGAATPAPEASEANFADHPEQTMTMAESGTTEGLVQLVQKLGSTLEKHREWSAQRAMRTAEQVGGHTAEQAPEQDTEQAASTHTEVPQEFEPAPADDAAEAMAAWFGRSSGHDDGSTESSGGNQGVPQAAFTPEPAVVAPAHTPAPPPATSAPAPGTGYAPFAGMGRLTVVDDDDDPEEEINQLAASFTLPISARMAAEAPVASAPANPRPAFDTPPEGAAEAPAAAPDGPSRDASYTSLAGMDNPFKRSTEDFVRIEEPEPTLAQPAVLFPNEQARKPAASQSNSGPRPFDRPFDRPAASASETEAPANVPAQPMPSGHPASNDDSERALREALMNLQRMGK